MIQMFVQNMEHVHRLILAHVQVDMVVHNVPILFVMVIKVIVNQFVHPEVIVQNQIHVNAK